MWEQTKPFQLQRRMSPPERDPVANQLQKWREENPGKLGHTTNSAGNPLIYKDATQTVGKLGPIVLQDWDFIDQIAHFNRERIPERVVHAKGAGAFGYFEVTHGEIKSYSAAKVFSTVGKRTPIAVRFSQVAGNMGSADSVRDPRGFAVKFYTEDGLWDLVGNNTPIFFVRDPILFIPFIHTQKRNPVTNTRDWDMFWDFLSLRPESIHQVMFLFSDRGIPNGYRHMNGYGSHTFSLIDEHSTITYCKFHYRTDQGIENLDPNEATKIAGEDPDRFIKDLYNAIAKGDYPTWSFYIQIMTPEEARTVSFNPFDITKVWPQRDYPLIPVGKLVLNRNPTNYFAEVEQLAFSPSNMIPGIGPSPDKFLQGRLFAYPDTHRYRLGTNYHQIPVNCPYKVKNFERDGKMTINNQGSAPNYHPNSFGGPETNPAVYKMWPKLEVSGVIDYYDTGNEDNYSQPRVFYREVMSEGERDRLVDNLVGSLKNCSEPIWNRMVTEFGKVDEEFGRKLARGIRQGLHAAL